MKTISNKLFFDITSEFYDEMINFDASLKRKKQAFKNIIPTKVKTVADLGCGSGIDSIALSELGYCINAFDISDRMIEKARKNAEEKNQTIKFNNYSIDKIPSSFNGQFDFICSLGNTFANLNRTQFKKSIERIIDLLSDKGTFLIHIINYQKILLEKNRILNITNKKENYYIRFYDFRNNRIDFNILNFNKDNPNTNNLITTKLYPHSCRDFEHIFGQKGFVHFKFYSSINKKPFDSDLSKDMYIYGIK